MDTIEPSATDSPSSEPHHEAPQVGRRRLMAGIAAGGLAVGAGAIGAVTARSVGASPFRRESLAVEVACLGPTWREATKSNPADDADVRAPFLVEGWIYPAGTIPGDGYIPTEENSIGRWFCRGWLLIDGLRPEPHVSSHQDFIFGRMTAEDLFPVDMITSTGLEGSASKAMSATRAVTGGTGRYLGATGVHRHRYMNLNSTTFPDGSGSAGNFEVQFDLWVLS